MSNISCFIVEDDPQALSYATSIIEKYGNIDIKGNSDKIEDAATQIKKIKPDFIILDVYLTDGNAFEFLNLFETIEFKIIFTTSFAEHAIDAFKFSALDYLLKPYDQQDLINALDKVNTEINKTNYQAQLSTLLHNISHNDQTKKIVLKNADAIHIVEIKDIVYAKSDNNYTTFYLSNKKEILVSKPIKTFNEKLIAHHFFRSHQSYLINLKFLVSYDKRHENAILKQDYAIPVAQSRKKYLLDYINTL